MLFLSESRTLIDIMKIIDAHIHYAGWEGFNATAAESGQTNTVAGTTENFRRSSVVMAIAMGAGRDEGGEEFCRPMTPNLAGTVTPEHYGQPDWVAYCAGVDSGAITPENTGRTLEEFEKYLKTPQCVGLKFYPGYHHLYLSDPRHFPFFELAAAYDVPVVIHTGDTAGTRGHVKYAHPLTVDEVAVNFPQTRFVLAHYGNPWFVDATEVMAKNENVFADLSGLAAGRIEFTDFLRRFRGYLDHMRVWMDYLDNWDRFLYGTDYPLVNIDTYQEVMKAVIPEEHHQKVFYGNALRVFPKLRDLLAKQEARL